MSSSLSHCIAFFPWNRGNWSSGSFLCFFPTGLRQMIMQYPQVLCGHQCEHFSSHTVDGGDQTRPVLLQGVVSIETLWWTTSWPFATLLCPHFDISKKLPVLLWSYQFFVNATRTLVNTVLEISSRWCSTWWWERSFRILPLTYSTLSQRQWMHQWYT